MYTEPVDAPLELHTGIVNILADPMDNFGIDSVEVSRRRKDLSDEKQNRAGTFVHVASRSAADYKRRFC